MKESASCKGEGSAHHPALQQDWLLAGPAIEARSTARSPAAKTPLARVIPAPNQTCKCKAGTTIGRQHTETSHDPLANTDVMTFAAAYRACERVQ